MKFEKLKLKGITRFDTETGIDFSNLPQGLIAVIGKNGAGKTTLMESTYAGIFRRLPSRDGELYEHCNGRDAFIEFTFSFNGNTYRTLINIDAEKRKQEAYIFDSNNEPLANGKVRDFDAYVKENLFTEDLFLSAIFNVQNKKGNFLELPKTERKALFIKMLGQGRLEQYSGTAKKCSDTYTTKIEILRSKVHDIERALENREDLLADKDILADEIHDIKETLKKAEAELKSVLGEETTHKEALKDLAILSEKIQDAQREMAQLPRKETLVSDYIGEKQEVEKHALEIERRITFAKEIISQKEKIEKAVEAKTVTEKANARIETELTALRKQAERFAAAKLTLQKLETQLGKDETQLSALKADAELIGQVPCGEQYPDCKFLKKAFVAKVKIKEIEEHISDINYEIKEVEYNPKAEDKARRDLQDKEELLTANKRNLVVISEMAEKQAVLKNAEARIIELTQDKQKAYDEIGNIESEHAKALRENEAKRAEIEQAMKDFEQSMGPLFKVKEQAELLIEKKGLAEKAVSEHREGIVGLNKKLGGIDGRLAELEKQATEKENKEQELSRALEEKREWDILSKALGKNGIQALEIDAAGPEVSSLTNELLNSCFGTRFAISFETTRESADGKKEVETFEPRVIDNERGREGNVVNLSPGEKVVVGEAISLALALYNREKSDKDIQTLFRDEPGTALDEDNSQRYIKMLRKALEVGGFYQLFFISHKPEFWEEADGKILVADDGDISVG